MLKRLYLVNLDKFHNFQYVPMRNTDDDCCVPVNDGSTENISHYSVYGQLYDSDNVCVDEFIADLSTVQEAATYCLLLNAALKGEVIEFDPQKPKEE